MKSNETNTLNRFSFDLIADITLSNLFIQTSFSLHSSQFIVKNIGFKSRI